MNTSCTDSFLTNIALLFQNTKTVSKSLSDFSYNLILTILKSSIVKNKPQEYSNYDFFDSRKFNKYLKKVFK